MDCAVYTASFRGIVLPSLGELFQMEVLSSEGTLLSSSGEGTLLSSLGISHFLNECLDI